MKQRYLDLLSTLLQYLLLGGAILYLVVYIVIACKRMNYPYELDWMEGAFVDHVKRILAGKQLYVEPSLEFTPYFYTPLYFYISAGVAKILGIGFLPLRLVSFVSSIGCFGLIFQFVRRETKSIFCAILSAGFYAATFKISGTWFDLARLDSLFLFFVLASIYLLRFRRDARAIVFAALLMFLAFLTKQSGLLIALSLSVYGFLVYDRWSRFLFPVTFLLMLGISTAILNWISDGWYYYYVFDLPTQHRIVKSMIWGFWRYDILVPLAIALGLSLAFLIYQFSKDKTDGFIFFALLFIGMIGSSWLSRMHSGSWVNVLFPAYAAMALFFGLGLQGLLSEHLYFSAAPQLQSSRDENNPVLERKFTGLFFLIISIFQFLLLLYKPTAYIPTRADAEAGDAFVRLLKDIKGELFISYPGFLPTLAGKSYYSDGGAIGDIFRGKDEELKTKLKANIIEAVRSKQFQTIITSSQCFGFFINSPSFVEEIKKHYVDKGPIFEDQTVFFHVTGGRVRPGRLFVLQD